MCVKKFVQSQDSEKMVIDTQSDLGKTCQGFKFNFLLQNRIFLDFADCPAFKSMRRKHRKVNTLRDILQFVQISEMSLKNFLTHRNTFVRRTTILILEILTQCLNQNAIEFCLKFLCFLFLFFFYNNRFHSPFYAYTGKIL